MSLSRVAPALSVFIGGAARTDAQVLFIEQNVGSRGLDAAQIQLEQPLHHFTQLQDLQLLDQWTNSIIEVQIARRLGEATSVDPRRLFYGRVVSHQTEISGQAEKVVLNCQLHGSLFGNRHKYQHQVAKLDPTKSSRAPVNATPPPDFDPIYENYTPQLQDYVAVLNPVIDGVATPNLWMGGSDPSQPPPLGSDPAFIDPDSIHPETLEYDRKLGEANIGISLLHSAAAFWSPAHAVYYFCKLLNAAETHVKNPTWSDVANLTDTSLLRDLRIPVDAYLPDILTTILAPIGYDWKIDYDDTDTLDRLNVLKIYRRFETATQSIGLQAWGADLDVALTEMSRMSLRFDAASRTAGNIEMLGAPKQYETTIVLRAAWDAQYDDYPTSAANAEKLKFNDDSWKTDPALKYAYRRFVANEGGDYTGTRAWFAAALDLATDVSPDFKLIKRREVLPMLSLTAEGEPIGETPPGVYVEYYDPNTLSWKPAVLNGGPIQMNVLDGELGLYISGQVPLLGVYLASQGTGTDVGRIQLRMTCTIESDTLLTTNVFDGSAITPTIGRVFDVASKYWSRSVDNSSEFAAASNSRETDGTTAMDGRANELLETYKQALITGTFELDGADRNMDGYLGARITSVNGRNIGTKTHPQTDPLRYPSVGQIRWEPQRQKIVLSLETPRA